MLHSDTYENLNCVISGRKQFVMFEPDHSTVIGPEHATLGFYHIDVDKVDLTAYPGLVGLPWYLAELKAGDCLYVPLKWIHHVRHENLPDCIDFIVVTKYNLLSH